MSSRFSQNGSALIGMLLLATGAVMLIVGVVLLSLLWLSPADPDTARNSAREGAESLTAYVDRIYRILGDEEVLEQARQVPPDQPDQTDALADTLTELGIEGLIDLRVYPPRAEEIEVGTYPETDFAAIQMLVEARRRETARARLHQIGTANEHMAFARSVPGAGNDVASIILLRLDFGLATEALAPPPGAAWLRLVQGSRSITSYPSGIEAESLGSETIEGSALIMEWGVPPATGLLGFSQNILVILLGLVLAAVGAFMRFGSVALPARRRSSVATATTASPSRPKDAGEKSLPQSSRPPPPPPPPASEPKPDLPDWLLDEDGGKGKQLPREDGVSEKAQPDGSDGLQLETLNEQPVDEPAAAPPSDGGLELDVPDLDDILRQIEEEGESASASEPAPAGDTDREDDSAASGSGNDASGLEIGDGFDLLTEDEAGDGVDEEKRSAADDGEAPLELELEPVVDRASESIGLESEDDSEPKEEAHEGGAGVAAVTGSDQGADFESEPQTTSAFQPSSKPSQQAQNAPSKATLEAIERSELFSVDLFDEDCIRGVFNRTMTAELATRMGRAIGTMAVQQGYRTIAVARDGRMSGPLLLSALIRGLRNSGLNVIEAGAVPLPALSYAAYEMADGCCVMVTASHYPPEQNGFKVMLGGRVLGRTQLMEVAQIAIEESFVEGEGSYAQEEVARQYATALAERVELKRPIKVVIDCGNGIAGAVVPVLFEALGADLIPLYCDVDGGFPNHAPNPSDPECLEDLRLCVRNFQAEIGIAFDGDADRMALVANDSEVAGTDQVLMLLARDLLTNTPDGSVVMDNRCAAQVRQVVEQAGGQLLVSGAGGVAMSNRVIEAGAMLGGEMGGQIVIARNWYTFADAIYTAAKLAELFAASKRSVQECLAELPQYQTSGEMVISVDDERGKQLIEQLSNDTDFDEGELSTVDGLRVDYPDRWALVRVRPGQGEIELRFSGEDPSALAQIKGEFREWLLAVDPDLRLPY